MLEFSFYTAEERVKRPREIAILSSFNIANCLDTSLTIPVMRARDISQQGIKKCLGEESLMFLEHSVVAVLCSLNSMAGMLISSLLLTR